MFSREFRFVVVAALVWQLTGAPALACQNWCNCCCPTPCVPVCSGVAKSSVQAGKLKATAPTPSVAKPSPASHPNDPGPKPSTAISRKSPTNESQELVDELFDMPSPTLLTEPESAETTPAPIMPEPEPSLPPAPLTVPTLDLPTVPLTEAPTEPPVAEPAPVESPLDDALFGEGGAEPSAPSDDVAPEPSELSDTFEEPAIPPAEESSAEVDPLDDLFGDPAPAPEAETPREEKQDLIDELFNQNLIRGLEEAGGLASNSTRTWTDATGTFRSEARLVSVAARAVLLRQADGAVVEVPLASLSEADLQFVRQQIEAQRMLICQQSQVLRLAAAWAK